MNNDTVSNKLDSTQTYNDDLRVTIWLLPYAICNNKCRGRYGYISNHNWLLKEKERLEGLGKKSVIVSKYHKEALYLCNEEINQQGSL